MLRLLSAVISENSIKLEMRIYYLISAWFVISRIVVYMLGIRFDDGGLGRLWQVADLTLLKERLWETVFYMHGQPPLYNLYIGACLKFLESCSHYIFWFTHLVMGFLSCLIMVFLLRKLRVAPLLALLVTGIYIIMPPVILYENWMFYTYPLSFFILLSTMLFYKFVETGEGNKGKLFFLSLAVIALTRSMFHLAWIIFTIAGITFLKPELRKRVLIGSVIPFILVLFWYTKNEAEFNTFGASSWFGFSLAKMTTNRLPDSLKDELIDEGKLSPLAGHISFSEAVIYRRYLSVPGTGIPVLDRDYKSSGYPNYHALLYKFASEKYKEDAMYVLKNYPRVYLGSVGVAFFKYFMPASEYSFLERNRNYIPLYDGLYRNIICGNYLSLLLADKNPESFKEKVFDKVHFNLIAWKIFFFIYALILLRRLIKKEGLSNRVLTIAFIMFNVIYVAVVGNLFDMPENNRFRFLTSPIFLVITGFGINEILRGWVKRER